MKTPSVGAAGRKAPRRSVRTQAEFRALLLDIAAFAPDLPAWMQRCFAATVHDAAARAGQGPDFAAEVAARVRSATHSRALHGSQLPPALTAQPCPSP